MATLRKRSVRVLSLFHGMQCKWIAKKRGSERSRVCDVFMVGWILLGVLSVITWATKLNQGADSSQCLALDIFSGYFEFPEVIGLKYWKCFVQQISKEPSVDIFILWG